MPPAMRASAWASSPGAVAKQTRLLDLVLERRPAAVLLSFWRSPSACGKDQGRGGAADLSGADARAQAKDAADSGAEILVAQGAEGGGHGISRSTFPFVPAVVDAAPGIPVVAAGGVADGRRHRLRGADAGRRRRADGHPVLCLAGGRGFCRRQGPPGRRDRRPDRAQYFVRRTRRNVWPAPYTGRVLRNAFSERWRRHEAGGLQHQEAEGERYAAAHASREISTPPPSSLAKRVGPHRRHKTAAEIVQRMVKEATTLLRGASNRYRIS